MENKFSQLGVNAPIVKAIGDMKFTEPTDVQEATIPLILNRKDLIVMSKTGSGKTGAFGIPIIQAIKPGKNGAKALILTPTRELAVQVDLDIKDMSKGLGIVTTAVYGQHSMSAEIQAFKQGAAIITGTPGRVADHIKRRTLDTSTIEYVVLDEADRMLDMGFIDEVIAIIKKIPRNRVTLLFSATMPPAIQRICKAYMSDPTTIELETDTMTVDTIKQEYYRVKRDEKKTQLDRLLKATQPNSCMVFCNTRIQVDRVQAYLARKGYIAEALHGANKQQQRMKTINKFKQNEIQVLVATDVAARGIHIDDLSLVINYDLSDDKNSYVHRIGRTGRAGNSGLAYSLVTSDDIMTLYEIEEHVGCLIEETPLPTDEEVKEALVKADGKWTKIVAPKPPAAHSQHKKATHGQHRTAEQSHHKKPGQAHANRPGQAKQTKPTHTKKHVEPVVKPSGHGSDKLVTKSQVKPVTKEAVKPKAQETRNHKPTTQKPTTQKSTTHKPKTHKPKTPPKKTKMVMTKMGPIEMIVKEKPSVGSKIKSMFGKSK